MHWELLPIEPYRVNKKPEEHYCVLLRSIRTIKIYGFYAIRQNEDRYIAELDCVGNSPPWDFLSSLSNLFRTFKIQFMKNANLEAIGLKHTASSATIINSSFSRFCKIPASFFSLNLMNAKNEPVC